jgi:hypothetical protein
MKKAAKSEKKRHGKIIPAVGVGLMTLTSTACASMRAADATAEVPSANVLMAEEEVSDVSLATFQVFDKEGPVRLAAGHGGGGCGHGGGGGCAHGGGGGCAHAGGGGCGHGGGCRVGACGHGGCGHGGCRGCRCAGGCGCGGCGSYCLVWAGPICIQ